MKKKSITSRYPVASVAVLIGVAGIAAGIWRQTIVSEIRSEAEAKEAEAAVLSQNVRNAQRLDTDLEQIKRINEALAERVTDPGDLAGNQQYFYKMEEDAGVRILELRKGAAAPAGGKKPALYAPVSYTVSIEGPFPRLLAFVRSVEGGSRAARIISAIVASPRSSIGDPEAVLTMTFELQLLAKS